MINGWGKLTLVHLGISSIFGYILAFGEQNMFTLFIGLVFVLATAHCAMQWYANRTIAKLEKKHPNWK